MVKIQFGSIRIRQTSHASSISSGTNYIVNRTDQRKSNEGFGNIEGKNSRIKGNQHVVIDQDTKDM